MKERLICVVLAREIIENFGRKLAFRTFRGFVTKNFCDCMWVVTTKYVIFQGILSKVLGVFSLRFSREARPCLVKVTRMSSDNYNLTKSFTFPAIQLSVSLALCFSRDPSQNKRLCYILATAGSIIFPQLKAVRVVVLRLITLSIVSLESIRCTKTRQVCK